MKCLIPVVCFVFLVENTNGSLRPRIIGGSDADIRDFPYQASLRLRGKHFCGGCIISDRHILTAAHCFADTDFRDVGVHTGTSSSRDIGNSHRIAAVHVHPGWARNSHFASDIAVILLADQIVFDGRQRRIELPSHDAIAGGAMAWETGWGCTTLARNPEASVQLQKLNMRLLSQSACQSQLPVGLREDELCAVHSRGHGFCHGDSGGPLVVNNQVVGIVSWIYNGDFASGIPEVHTNVYVHRIFIHAAMNPHYPSRL